MTTDELREFLRSNAPIGGDVDPLSIIRPLADKYLALFPSAGSTSADPFDIRGKPRSGIIRELRDVHAMPLKVLFDEQLERYRQALVSLGWIA